MRKILVSVTFGIGFVLICLFAEWPVFVGVLMIIWAWEKMEFKQPEPKEPETIELNIIKLGTDDQIFQE